MMPSGASCPVQFGRAPLLIINRSAVYRVVAMDGLRTHSTASNVSLFTSLPAICSKMSPVIRRLPAAEEGCSLLSGRFCRRELLICSVASLANANANGSAAVSVPGKSTPNFLLRENMEEDRDPIRYDKRDPPTIVTAPGRRIVAVGDLHGDLPKTESALQLAGVLSTDGLGNWIGGNTVFVQVGDILDRGDDEIAILSLLHNLGKQAPQTGGAVFQINGNHETMNVEGDYRYVDSGGFDEAVDFTIYCEDQHAGNFDSAFAGWYAASKKRKSTKPSPFIVNWLLSPLRQKVSARTFLFHPGGPLARKLSQHGVVLKVNDWLFAHGGVLPQHVKYGLENLNSEVSQWMRGEFEMEGGQRKQFPFMAVRGYDSIVWSRLYSREDQPEKIRTCAILEATLEAVGAKGLVVGHTPQEYGANSDCKGQVWRIDVGMSKGVFRAEPEVLEIYGNDAHVLSGRRYKGQETEIIPML